MNFIKKYKVLIVIIILAIAGAVWFLNQPKALPYAEFKPTQRELMEMSQDDLRGLVAKYTNLPEIEKKKLELRMENERYFRQHPEINSLL